MYMLLLRMTLTSQDRGVYFLFTLRLSFNLHAICTPPLTSLLSDALESRIVHLSLEMDL